MIEIRSISQKTILWYIKVNVWNRVDAFLFRRCEQGISPLPLSSLFCRCLKRQNLKMSFFLAFTAKFISLFFILLFLLSIIFDWFFCFLFFFLYYFWVMKFFFLLSIKILFLNFVCRLFIKVLETSNKKCDL